MSSTPSTTPEPAQQPAAQPATAQQPAVQPAAAQQPAVQPAAAQPPLTAEEKADQARQLPPSGPTPAYEVYRKEIEEEWGQYVATSQIYVGNALAYNVGDPVPAANVERFRYLDQQLVEKVEPPAPDAG